MQDALLALKQLIQQTQTDLTETKQDISTVCLKFFVSSFIGNGQSTITIPWPEEKPFDTPYLTIISHKKGSSSSDKNSIAIAYGDIFLFFATENSFPADSSYVQNGWAQIKYNNNGNLFTVNIGSNNSYNFNLSNRTYNYLVLGI